MTELEKAYQEALEKILRQFAEQQIALQAMFDSTKKNCESLNKQYNDVLKKLEEVSTELKTVREENQSLMSSLQEFTDSVKDLENEQRQSANRLTKFFQG